MSGAHLRRTTARSWPQRLVLALGALIVLAALGGAGVAGYAGFRLSQVTRYGDVEVTDAASGEPVNYLIVGSDSRENITPEDPAADRILGDEVAGKRSDTIMVLRVDPKATAAHLLSLPRDLWVDLADGHGRARINSAYSYGRQVLVDTVEATLGLTVNHYVEIDFVAFRDIVDEMGGVPLYFAQPVRDRHSGLAVPEAGCRVLGGQAALDFSRSRYLEYRDDDGDWHRDPTADLGRITRQQVFIRRALSRALDQGLSNPRRLDGLLGVLLPKIGIDEGLRVSEVVSMARRFGDFDPEHLVTHTVPTESFETAGGAKVERLVPGAAEPVLNVFRGLPPDAVRPAAVPVQVLNGSGLDGQAAAVSQALATIGFPVGEPATAPTHVTRTTVRYGVGAEAGARLVAGHVTGGAVVEPDPSLGAGTVVLVTGDDLTTLHRQPAPTDTATDTATDAGASGDPGVGVVGRDGGAASTDDTTGPGVGGRTGEAPTTTSTVVGYATGEPPAGVTCA